MCSYLRSSGVVPSAVSTTRLSCSGSGGFKCPSEFAEPAAQDAHAKAEQTAQATGFDEHPTLIKPVGVLESEESTLSGKCYADRPEGLDQFGGEESERQRVHDTEIQARTGTSDGLKNYSGNPGGIDTFGGEDTERKL